MEKARVAVLVRIRPALKAKLAELAKSEHRSVNQQIEFLLERSISREAQHLANESPPAKTEPKAPNWVGQTQKHFSTMERGEMEIGTEILLQLIYGAGLLGFSAW
jgi:hypothetical protein